MRINRFYLPQKFELGPVVVDNQPLVDQIRKVLRLKTGDSFVIFDGAGVETLVNILAFNKNSISLEAIKQEKFFRPIRQVNIFMAILKKENFDWAILKSVETGIQGIYPLISDRTVKFGLNYNRLQTIIKEGVEQSGQNFLPSLSSALKFEQAIKLNSPQAGLVNIMAEAKELPDLSLLDCDFSDKKIINIWIGPEGGWSDKELELARRNDFVFVNLGCNILRAETAVVIASWLAVNKK